MRGRPHVAAPVQHTDACASGREAATASDGTTAGQTVPSRWLQARLADTATRNKDVSSGICTVALPEVGSDSAESEL